MTRPPRISAPGRRDARGAAAIELAIVLPLLLLLVCGVVDFGRMLNLQITLSGAAREGARWAALRLDTTTGTPVSARVTAAAPGIAGAPTTAILSSCPSNPSPTQNASVTATRVYTLITPLNVLSGLFGGGIPGTVTLTGRGVMRCGG
jgi:Flp pilus assembly protein TadG